MLGVISNFTKYVTSPSEKPDALRALCSYVRSVVGDIEDPCDDTEWPNRLDLDRIENIIENQIQTSIGTHSFIESLMLYCNTQPAYCEVYAVLVYMYQNHPLTLYTALFEGVSGTNLRRKIIEFSFKNNKALGGHMCSITVNLGKLAKKESGELLLDDEKLKNCILCINSDIKHFLSTKTSSSIGTFKIMAEQISKPTFFNKEIICKVISGGLDDKDYREAVPLILKISLPKYVKDALKELVVDARRNVELIEMLMSETGGENPPPEIISETFLSALQTQIYLAVGGAHCNASFIKKSLVMASNNAQIYKSFLLSTLKYLLHCQSEVSSYLVAIIISKNDKPNTAYKDQIPLLKCIANGDVTGLESCIKEQNLSFSQKETDKKVNDQKCQSTVELVLFLLEVPNLVSSAKHILSLSLLDYLELGARETFPLIALQMAKTQEEWGPILKKSAELGILHGALGSLQVINKPDYRNKILNIALSFATTSEDCDVLLQQALKLQCNDVAVACIKKYHEYNPQQLRSCLLFCKEESSDDLNLDFCNNVVVASGFEDLSDVFSVGVLPSIHKYCNYL